MQQNVYEIQVMDYFRSGNIFTGSRKGLRYKVEGVKNEEEEKVFRVTLWPEPLCFEKTPEYQKETAFFPFHEEGREMLLAYLKEHDEKEYWKVLAQRKPPEKTEEAEESQTVKEESDAPFDL